MSSRVLSDLTVSIRVNLIGFGSVRSSKSMLIVPSGGTTLHSRRPMHLFGERDETQLNGQLNCGFWLTVVVMNVRFSGNSHASFAVFVVA